MFFSENPTPKFGEALRAQVEERLNFFETGAPPSKNADAIRKVLDALALEEDDEDEDAMDTEPVLPLIEVSPKKEKKKKRKSDAMDVDEDEEEEPAVKKVKLSKEEKKALKKAAKQAAKEEAKKLAVEVSQVLDYPRPGTDVRFHRLLPVEWLSKRRRSTRRRRKRRKRAIHRVYDCSDLSSAVLIPCIVLFIGTNDRQTLRVSSV